MKRALFSLALLATVMASVHAQTVTIGTGTIVNTTTGYPTPYGNFYWGCRTQYLVTAAEMSAAGAVAGPIVSLGFDVVSFAGQPHLNYDIKLGHSLQTVMTNWETGLTWVYSAPSYTPVPGWNTHTFCSPFNWDGVSNIVVEACSQNSSYLQNAIVNSTAGAVNLCKYYRADAAGVCANTGQTGVSLNRANMQFMFGAPPTIEYQSNSSGASLTMGTASTNGCIAPIFTQQAYLCGASTIGATGSINFSSTALGMPWDIVISSGNLAPLSAGGLAIPSGIINLDLSQPFGFVNGFFGSNLPNFTFPGVSSASLTWGYSITSNVNNTLQSMAINPTAPGGASLSQAVEYHCVLNVNGVASLAGPTADDAVTTMNLSTPQVCWPSITMYGTSYTTMHVVSNGRVMFGTTSTTDFSPTVAEAQSTAYGPFVGFWTDLNPSQGGLITATQPAAGIVRVDYAAVPYDVEVTATNTFGIQFDTLTGQVQMDGLSGIVANPQVGFSALYDSQYLGMSRCNGATDGGITTFAAGSSGTAVSPTSMWYDWYGAIVGGAGRVGSLVPGTLNAIVFAPSVTMAPNYDWAGF